MGKNTIKILLVEDDEGDILLTKRALANRSQHVGFVAESAKSLSEAVKCLDGDEKYDVILLDMGLPDSSGIETVRKVCKTTDTPIVVLTGLGDDETGLSAIKIGAADYLTKDMPLEKFLVRTIRYVLERKRIEDELKAAHVQLIRTEKLATVGQLTSIVAHELRNPLAVIKNAAYLLNLEEEIKTAPEVKENVDMISDEVNNANKIISDLLQFSRVKEPTLKPANINAIVKKVLNQLKTPAGIRLTMKLHNNLPDIEMDSRQIEQVFCNIITNAVQAMADDGELTIETNLYSNHIVTSITDTGSGIAEENLEKIFEPLFSTKAKGTGLGLPVCALLIEKHSGKINVKSRPDEGTTFTIKLPITKITEEPEKVSAAPTDNSAVAVAAKGD